MGGWRVQPDLKTAQVGVAKGLREGSTLKAGNPMINELAASKEGEPVTT